MTMFTAAPERLADILDSEIKPLLPMHWEALALNRDRVPLDPQYDIYLRREQIGEVCCVVLRHNGRLVGYWITFVAPGLHYRTCLNGTMDILFIHPDHRRGPAALVLGRTVERELRRRGVQWWAAGEKLHAPIGRLFTALGMAPFETYYGKWIGD
jgi:GNAT superfamily N-acetyltransferase